MSQVLTNPEQPTGPMRPLASKALAALRSTPLEHLVLFIVMITSGLLVDDYPRRAIFLSVAGLLSAMVCMAFRRLAWGALAVWCIAALGSYVDYYEGQITPLHLSATLLSATALLWVFGVCCPSRIRKPDVQDWAVTLSALLLFGLVRSSVVVSHFPAIEIVSYLLVPVSLPLLLRYWVIDERRVLSPVGAARWALGWGLFAWLYPIGTWRHSSSLADNQAWLYGLVAAHLFVACYATLVVTLRKRKYWQAVLGALVTLTAELILVMTLILPRIRDVAT